MLYQRGFVIFVREDDFLHIQGSGLQVFTKNLDLPQMIFP